MSAAGNGTAKAGDTASARDLEAIERAVTSGDEVRRIIRLTALHVAPDELLVAARLAMAADGRLEEVSARLDVVDARIRQAVPAARTIYLEPALRAEPSEAQPPTDAIIIRTSD